MAKNALDVWGFDKEQALHKFFVGEPMGWGLSPRLLTVEQRRQRQPPTWRALSA